MKIQCDVCNKAAATVFCVADEAAICGSCDLLVHQANKLASKHPRLSLVHSPSDSDGLKQQPHGHAPLCDVCQKRGAIMFCQQDRAVLCKDCDVLMHTANEHAMKHSRFLITRVELSSSCPPLLSDLKPTGMNQEPACIISEAVCYGPSLSMTMGSNSVSYDQWAGGGFCGGGEMLQEALMMEMLHGGWWDVDGLQQVVDSSCSASALSPGFSENFTLQRLAPAIHADPENHSTEFHLPLGSHNIIPLAQYSTTFWQPTDWDIPVDVLHSTSGLDQ